MSFTDPQIIKVGATENSLSRIVAGDRKSVYSTGDEATKFEISTQVGKRRRQVARVDVSKVVPSTLISSQNEEVGASVYLVVDRPIQGYTNAQIKEVIDGFLSNLQASTGANITKMLNGES